MPGKVMAGQGLRIAASSIAGHIHARLLNLRAISETPSWGRRHKFMCMPAMRYRGNGPGSRWSIC